MIRGSGEAKPRLPEEHPETAPVLPNKVSLPSLNQVSDSTKNTLEKEFDLRKAVPRDVYSLVHNAKAMSLLILGFNFS